MFFPSLEEAQLKEKAKRFVAAIHQSVSYRRLAGCCGFHEIYGWERINIADFKQFRDETVTFLSESTNFTKSEGPKQPGALLTTIAGFQVSAMEPIFEEAGFTLVCSARNKKTDNTVHMYQKILHKVKV